MSKRPNDGDADPNAKRARPPPPDVPVPPGWTLELSRSRGTYYLFNAKTNESKWIEDAHTIPATNTAEASPAPVVRRAPTQPAPPVREAIPEPPRHPIPEAVKLAMGRQVTPIAVQHIADNSMLAMRPVGVGRGTGPTCPHLEQLRAAEMLKTRTSLSNKCWDLLDHQEPDMSVERWMMVQKFIEGPAEMDPVIPHGGYMNMSMYKELVEADMNPSDALQTVEALAEAARLAAEKMSHEKACKRGEGCYMDTVRTEFAHHRVRLTWREQSFQLNQWHFDLLQQRYAATVGDTDLFLLKLFTLLIRYDAIRGVSYQSALAPAVFNFLRTELAVTQECFASPLNCTLQNFCSAFPDVDCDFSSTGNFFQWEPKEGSFEANPPFVEEIMKAMVERIDMLLDQATGPMSFTVCVPEWPDAAYFLMLRGSSHLKGLRSIPRKRHWYFVGDQHRAEQPFWAVNFNTGVFILQNEKGAEKYPVDEDLMNRLVDAFAINPNARY